jgi:hypothetical protein
MLANEFLFKQVIQRCHDILCMFSHTLHNNLKTDKKSVYYNFPVTIFKLNHLTKLAEGKHRI